MVPHSHGDHLLLMMTPFHAAKSSKANMVNKSSLAKEDFVFCLATSLNATAIVVTIMKTTEVYNSCLPSCSSGIMSRTQMGSAGAESDPLKWRELGEVESQARAKVHSHMKETKQYSFGAMLLCLDLTTNISRFDCV